MKLKSLAAVAVIALSSITASATITTTTTGPVSVTGSFTDVILGSFTLSGPSNVAGALGFGTGNVPVVVPGFGTFSFALQPVAFTGVSVGPSLTSNGSLPSFSFSNLAAGLYNLKATGSVGSGSTNFIQASYTVTPVPEPETFAMLLAGLGLMGAIARRRNNSNAA